MIFALRPYQSDCVAEIRKAFLEYDSLLIELATGCGKTEVFTEIARTWEQGRVLVVCPMVELIGQAVKKIYKRTGIMPDIEQSTTFSNVSEWGWNAFIVGSKQSLCKMKGDARRWERLKNIGLVIVDEAHLSITPEYDAMFSYFRGQGAKFLGVTATAKRHDKRAMGQLYKHCCYQYGIVPAVADGWLVSAVAECVQLKTLDLSGVTVKQTVHGKDFSTSELNEKMENLETVYEIADVTARESGNLKTVVYCASVQEAKLVSERLADNYQIKSDWICSKEQLCTKQRREEVLRSFTTDPQGVQVVCNMGILTTGWDFPGLQHIVMARPTRSLSLYTQIFGRGTRPLEGVVDFEGSTPELRRAAIAASAKPHFKVTDLVDASMEHKIVTSVDVLGGKFEMPVVEMVKKDILENQGGPVDIEKALLDAQAELERQREEAERRRRAQVQARADYAKVQVDPFDVYSRGTGTAKKKSGVVMPFGKFKGVPVADIKTDYLRWVLSDCERIKPYLKVAISSEIAARTGKAVPASPQAAYDRGKAYQAAKQKTFDDINSLLLER